MIEESHLTGKNMESEASYDSGISSCSSSFSDSISTSTSTDSGKSTSTDSSKSTSTDSSQSKSQPTNNMPTSSSLSHYDSPTTQFTSYTDSQPTEMSMDSGIGDSEPIKSERPSVKTSSRPSVANSSRHFPGTALQFLQTLLCVQSYCSWDPIKDIKERAGPELLEECRSLMWEQDEDKELYVIFWCNNVIYLFKFLVMLLCLITLQHQMCNWSALRIFLVHTLHCISLRYLF